MSDKESIVLSLPAQLREQMEKAGRKAGYETVEEYILYLLGELFPETVEKLDKEEIAIVEQRLRDLGYM